MITRTQGAEGHVISTLGINTQNPQEASIQSDPLKCTSHSLSKEWRYEKSHPQDLIIGNPSLGTKIISSFNNICDFHPLVTPIESKIFLEAKNDENLFLAIQKKLNQFERNQVWELVQKLKHTF